jgi:ribosome-binding factor A
MESTRLNKINRLLQKELGEMFLKLTQTTGGTLVSVTSVTVSADLSTAKVYVSIFPVSKQKEILALIKNSTKGIRFELGQRIRYQVRKVPELTFFVDDSLDYIENIDRLLGNNQKEEE